MARRFCCPRFALDALSGQLFFAQVVQHLLLILVAAACLVYVALAAILFSLWLRESEARDLRMERFAQRDPITLEAERRRMLAGDRAD